MYKISYKHFRKLEVVKLVLLMKIVKTMFVVKKHMSCLLMMSAVKVIQEHKTILEMDIITFVRGKMQEIFVVVIQCAQMVVVVKRITPWQLITCVVQVVHMIMNH